MKHSILLAAVVACKGAAIPQPSSGITLIDRLPVDALELDVSVGASACLVTNAQGGRDPELHVPAGRAVRLVLGDADSLDHDVAVATAHVHVTAGTFKQIGFRIDRPGTYEWQCSKLARIHVTSAEDYAAYQHREAPPSTREEKIALAKQLYERKGCVACHTVDGTPRVGPSWAGIWGKNATLSDGSVRIVDGAYVEQSILQPQAFARPGYPSVMPSFEGNIKPYEITALVTYIESLAR